MNALRTRMGRPRSDGLPDAWTLWWFPAVLAVLLVVAVVAAVSGSSTGTWAILLGHGPDPRLLWGQPRSIRSDEWLAQGSWLVSQTHQGFPQVNGVFPGGADATVFNDAPTWDWSGIFRPQLWGSLLLGLDHGLAFRWWIQFWMLLSAIHVFVVSVLPRRPLLGAIVALATVFQPLMQWWWFPPLTLPTTLAFAAMTAGVWALRGGSRLALLVPAALAGYLAVSTSMTLYLPFMLACGYPALAFVAGDVLDAIRRRGMPVREVLRRLVPLGVAAAAAGAVLVVWVLTRRQTIEAVLHTAYPGSRHLPVGDGTGAELVTLFSAPFDRALTLGQWAGLGSNQSTSSAPFMIGLFLVVPLVWMAVRGDRRPDWPVVMLVLAQAFVLAVMYLPGWDLLARVLLVDKSPSLRFRASFLVLAVIAVVLLVERLDRAPKSVPWLASAITGAVVVLLTLGVWGWLAGQGSPVVPSAYAVVVTLVLAGGLFALTRGWATAGATALLVCSLVVAASVNPLYRGIFDPSRDTQAGRMVTEIGRSHPSASWVGVGTSGASMGLLFEAGVPAYSGVQTFPSRTMWRQIDPTGSHEYHWNRLAHIHWVAGSGAPDPRQPSSRNKDVIEVTFDSCGAFAQAHVSYVLGEGDPLRQRCLRRVAAFGKDTRVPLTVYRVEKSG